MNKLIDFLKEKKVLWGFSILLISKLIYLLIVVEYTESNIDNSWFPLPEDDEGYVTCVENFFERGEWFYDKLGMAAPRVPGQSLSYALFRLFLPMGESINSLIIFQILVYSVSIVLLAKVLSKSLNSNFAFWITIVLFAVEQYNSTWNNFFTLGESLGNSWALIGIVFLIKYLENRKISSALLAGVFIGTSFFYKVVNLFLIAVCCGVIAVVFLRAKEWLKGGKIIIFFLLPFVVLETLWVSRNYVATGEFIPLQQVKSAPADVRFNSPDDPWVACVMFMKSFGGSWVRWNANSSIAWFNDDSYLADNGFERPSFVEVFPSWMMSENINEINLSEARRHWWKSEDLTLSESERVEHSEVAAGLFNKFKEEVINEHYFHYQITSRLIYMKEFFLHSGTYYIPFSFEEANVFEKGFKLVQMLLYWLILFLGFGTLVYKLIRRESTQWPIIISSLLIAVFLLLYCGVFRTSELRYNSLMFVGLMILAVYPLTYALKKILDKKLNLNFKR